MYSTVWTQFETQSLLYGVLRKEFYPTYIVRGEVGKIKIYKPTADKYKPVLLLTINVHASTNASEVGIQENSPQEITAVGGTVIKDLVKYLHARVAKPSVSAPSPI